MGSTDDGDTERLDLLPIRLFAGKQPTKEELFNATVRGQEQGPLFAAAAEVPAAPAAEAPGAGLVAEGRRISQAEVTPPEAVPPVPKVSVGVGAEGREW